MQHIKIYDKHEDWQENGISTNCMILGVHSFVHYLNECANKKNVKIFLKGKCQQIIQNILWNQYYSYTLLKDIQRTIFAQAERKNIFVKVDSKTFRLLECFQQSSYKKIQAQISRCPNFVIQGFMCDSSIKFLSVEIGQYRTGQYDIIFQYNHRVEQASFSLSWAHANRSQNNYSCLKSLKNVNNVKNQQNNIAVKSLFQTQQHQPQPRQRKQNYSIKYQTEKKNKQSRTSIVKNQMYNKTRQLSKKPKNSTLSKRSKKQREITSAKFSQSNYNYNNTNNNNNNNYKSDRQSSSITHNKITKQQTTATILFRKQQKIRQYRKLLDQKQRQFEQKINKMQLSHQQEVQTIKNQVKDVLNGYKKKNKALKKENICLTEMNDKLVLANKKLEQALQQMNQNMQMLKQGQKQLQKNNYQYSTKLQNIQNANNILLERINKQQLCYQSQIVQKDKVASQIKSKYQRLLGNIKNATADVDKENFH